MQTKQITAHEAWEFLQQFEQAVKEGYTLCESNANFPRIMSGMLSVGVVKALEAAPATDAEDESPEAVPEAPKEPTEKEAIKQALEEKLGEAAKPQRGRPVKK